MYSPAEERIADLLARNNQIRPGYRGKFVENYFAELLQVPEVSGARDLGYDFRLFGEYDNSILVQLKVFTSTSFGKNRLNQVSSLVSSSVFARRNAKSRAAVVGIVMLAGGPVEDATTAPLDRFAEELMLARDGVGFEAIFFVVPTLEARLIWYIFGSEGDRVHRGEPHSTDDALTILRRVEPIDERKVQPSRRDDELRRKRILLVADEWKSGRGGISTINRELSAALATEGADVVVMLPEASEDDRVDASDQSVVLAYPASIPGLTERESLLLRPIFPIDGWVPDVIIGHGRILGPHAAAQKAQYFPDAKRVHLVHMDAEQLESAKEQVGAESRMASAASRRATEKSLALTADHVFGIGPLLADTISDDLIGEQNVPSVGTLIPGLRSEIDLAAMHAPARNRVLFVGRADDFHSKGVDLLADAMIQISYRWRGAPQQVPELIIRGVPDGLQNEVKRQLDDIGEQRFKHILRSYSSDVAELQGDISQSRVMVMPSRHEGFGLAAWEGIAAGIPILITAESGVAQFLQSKGIDTPRSSILPVRDGHGWSAVDKWVDALEWIFDYSDQARESAFRMREELRRVVDWQSAAKEIMRSE